MRLFRSGDEVRVFENGSIHVMGRVKSDREVTIKDKRVNLDQIAEVITREASPSILDAAVSWREESEMLVAFVTLADESIDDTDVFLHRLKVNVSLPEHMVPDVILTVDSVPKAFSGTKAFHAIDKLILPEAIPSRAPTESFSPFEMRVKSIWGSLISIDSLNDLKPESDFSCAGGNSLLLISLQASLQSELGCSLRLPDMFQFSTIRSLATWIQGRAGDVEGMMGG